MNDTHEYANSCTDMKIHWEKQNFARMHTDRHILEGYLWILNFPKTKLAPSGKFTHWRSFSPWRLLCPTHHTISHIPLPHSLKPFCSSSPPCAYPDSPLLNSCLPLTPHLILPLHRITLSSFCSVYNLLTYHIICCLSPDL